MIAASPVCKYSIILWRAKKTRLEHETLKVGRNCSPVSMSSDSCCHLWVCDNAQRVFFIEDVYGAVKSIHASLTIANAPAASDLIKWRRVEGSLEKVAGGFSGIVCGILRGVKGTVLCVRRGVTHDKPFGSSWAKAFCDAIDIAVGRQYIVRKTSHGEFFITDINKLNLSTPVFLPSWSIVPSCSKFVKEFQHFVLDERDNLLIITPSGEVYGCLGLGTDVENSTWSLVAKPPIETKRRFSFLGFWRGQQDTEETFSQICAGSRSLWCLKKDSDEIWQLVLTEFTNMAGETTLKTNWIKFNLPKNERVLHLCADKIKIDALYAVEDEEKLVSYTLLHDNSGKLELPNPNTWNQSWKSVAICCTQVPQIDTRKLRTTEHQPSSLYPKLPRDDFDVCCETGDCVFCRSAEERRLLIPSFPADLQPVEEEPKQGNSEGFPKRKVIETNEGMLAVKKARLEQSSFQGSQSYHGLHSKRKRVYDDLGQCSSDDEVFHTTLMYQPKRARLDHPEFARYFLVDDVNVAVKKNPTFDSKVS